MRKFKVGKYYTPATVPSIEPLECVSSTDFMSHFATAKKTKISRLKRK